jgi:hypothetical protein
MLRKLKKPLGCLSMSKAILQSNSRFDKLNGQNTDALRNIR